MCCGAKKRPVETATLDSAQAYEQTLIWVAVADLMWAAAYVFLVTGARTVTVFRDYKGGSKLGGTVSDILTLTAAVVFFDFAEVVQYVWVILGICVIQFGDSVWWANGVTIGNPFGRIALGATTGRDELMRDWSWAAGCLLEPEFAALAALGFTRVMVFACSKYVDDCSVHSLLTCRNCIMKFIKGTYRATFDVAEHRKFLDIQKILLKIKGGPQT